ncbi:NitT/TauT family transport system substrate-binding protein [Paenibacillus sophorae]|uniref:ABC transporter substrate-binding protein n=1 Tax=Paenibacillus sophorae TaxID=1333845 RepID=A0A1H8P981_9BACL|nr:ABC transporter substrate-binding protein [Paenibacillus sophorae]QWU16481.1 ABC transporter substrate-binding protein [Paenibacillus sophorae]SEO38337.1 NitT/TauT family transport system substrate-binding protein [Paenibacillus sophorae]
MKSKQSRVWKAVAGAMLLTGILISLAGCGDAKAETKEASDAPALQKVRIGGDSAIFSLQFRVAKAEGFFEKNGIDAEISTFSFGIDTLNAVLTDRVDVGEAMDYAALSALSKGDLKVLSLFSSPKATSSKLYARDGISRPEDLIGKKLGVQKGTVNEYIWGKYFETFHIDKKDVTLVPLQSTAEILAAYDRGDIQAAWFGTAFFDKAEKVEGSKALNDQSAINIRTKGFLVAKDSLIKDKPQISAGLNKALAEASQYITDHPEEAAELAFKEVKIPKDNALREIKNEWEFDVRFNQEDYDQLKEIKEWSVANGYIEQDFKLDDKLALEGLKEAFPDKVTIQ